MAYNYNVTGDEKKRMIKVISDFLDTPSKYMRVPTCAYKIGSYSVSKEGALSWEDGTDTNQSSALMQALEAAGFHTDDAPMFTESKVDQVEPAPEADEAPTSEETELAISMPRYMFSDAALDNLRRLVESKGRLMKRAFKSDKLPVKVDDEKVSFPWFPVPETPEQTKAYTTFIDAICDMAIKQTRINTKEKEIVNEKYEFRCFLLRLGFIGNEYKQIRKELLKNLSGSAAFKSGARKGVEQV